MDFEFATAGRIVFGAGAAQQARKIMASMGRRSLVVTGANPLRWSHLAEGPQFPVDGEPTVALIREGVAFARAEGCDSVISIGGGSAIDAGKALAALLANPGDALDYLEVIGGGLPLAHAPVPFVAVPTTAGTGSEVTRNAVLASPEHSVKASLRSASMLPRVALVDPDLTADLPRGVTAATGLDALTQLIEPFVSVKANPMTDLYCVEGIHRAAKALPRACRNGHDREARADMAWASLLGGLALANAGLGVVHGFAAPVGGRFPAPHGAICAAVLGPAMAVNVRAARERAPATLLRFDRVAQVLTGRSGAIAEEGVRWIAALCEELQIPPLRTYGVAQQDVPMLVEKAARTSSMRGNPIELTVEELSKIIVAAI